VGAQLARRLAEVEPGVPVVLDLRTTSYLASAGVGVVLEARARAEARGVPFRVRTAPGSPPERILALTGLDGVLRGPAPTPSGDDRASAPVTGS
jgi:anti-anti-sigma factor